MYGLRGGAAKKRNKMEFKKAVNLLDIFCITVGVMISCGLLVLPALAYARTGAALIFSYFFAGLFAIAGALSQAELISSTLKSPGTYFYVVRSMGPAIGTIDGILTWFSLCLRSAFLLMSISFFISPIFNNLNFHLIAIGFCILFSILSLIGIKDIIRFQVILILGFIIFLTIYLIMGIPRVNLDNFWPFMPHGITPVITTAGFVFISYGELLKIASVAEDMKNPDKIIPTGLILSLAIGGILYTLIIFVTLGILGPSNFYSSPTPIVQSVYLVTGLYGKWILSMWAILVLISTTKRGIALATRYPAALSKDRLLPKFLSITHPVFKTPFISIILTGSLIAIFTFFDLNILIEVGSTVLILTFIFSCLCVIIMRESGIKTYTPKFYTPFYPWLQIFGIISCWFLVINMSKIALFVSSFLCAAGIAIYWFYGRIRCQKDFALLHLMAKIIDKDGMNITKEEELKEIIQERDDIIKDRFDQIMGECIVLDIDQPMKRQDFFKLAAKKLASRTGVNTDEIYRLLEERESKGCTAISPGIAIPHIITGEGHSFEILLARSKKGIIFCDSENPVKTVFVIVGTKDERPFHLIALSAIAQIVQDTSFPEKWMKAKNEDDLRNIILLCQRKRNH
ncbi:cationic amino acid transporter [Candidatus Omnitrophus magneticus]|uniref:Cationic amino acid transporter n=1 Tax=Candidatus Omnitrophus magneticus TaxID=1609969 RepID=A0A0F0CT52_9BACT|nr:cationic amino acid transporter [Candidatus Omnitrophus magneticus]